MTDTVSRLSSGKKKTVKIFRVLILQYFNWEFQPFSDVCEDNLKEWIYTETYG